ncbi:hypothetical protein V6N13_088551 [Hibiscus sabdariffa]|uniref:Uncharacterized protein n=1 Tax=Hibiscus sabdariffa TaxID=183260 RepID=A0ABR2FZQ3_9ROSI
MSESPMKAKDVVVLPPLRRKKPGNASLRGTFTLRKVVKGKNEGCCSWVSGINEDFMVRSFVTGDLFSFGENDVVFARRRICLGLTMATVHITLC